MTKDTTPTSGAADLPEALRSIQRFEVVDCIDDKHVPAVIPNPHGPWVRYGDHIAALAAGQATAVQGVAYAALPESFLEIPDVQDESGINAYYSREAVLECIDAALASHGQAPAGAGEPTEQQILEAAEKAGLRPNTVRSWIPAFHRYHKELAKAQPAPAQAAEPVAVVAPCYTPSGKRVALCSAKQDLPIGTKLYAAPQPSYTAQAADSVPAVEREQERIAFKDAHRHLELDEVPDAWGRPMFKHSHVEASWLGWIARASHGQAPVPPPECETEAEKRAFAFGWFKALESERMKADNKKKDPL